MDPQRHPIEYADASAEVSAVYDDIMAPGALDRLTKELVYIAASVTKGCRFCIALHGTSARSKGMTEQRLSELMAVIGLASETNGLATGYDEPVGARFTET